LSVVEDGPAKPMQGVAKRRLAKMDSPMAPAGTTRKAASAARRAVKAPVPTPVKPDAPALDLGHLPELIGYMLRRAQLAVFQDFAQTYAEVGIRPAQYAALTVIERNPGLKQKDVSAALGIKRANFVAMCDELEALGLAARRPIATDRRSYALHLTRKGRALMKTLHAANQEHEMRLTAQIGEEGRARLIVLLTALAATGNGAGEGSEEG
jgi:DNA-binding MarR family transcriptional regulator